MSDFFWIFLASFSAGLVDAMVGGGGLILLPALFSIFPQVAPASLLGTNKATSIWGTSLAAFRYARRVSIPWSLLWPVAIGALGFSAIGARVAIQIDAMLMRQILPFVLLGIFIDTLRQKQLGQLHTPCIEVSLQMWLRFFAIGAAIGLYDGVFGPGTGSVLIFLFVRWMSFDFLHASASAKFINLVTNAAALFTFAWHDHVWWHVVVFLACANLAGSLVGTHLALRYGSRLVRYIFLGVVGCLIAKLIFSNLANAFY